MTAERELYRSCRRVQQGEGIALAKKRGKYKGRKKLDVDELKFRSVCDRVRLGAITAEAAMKELNISRSTFYRKVREIEGQQLH